MEDSDKNMEDSDKNTKPNIKSDVKHEIINSGTEIIDVGVSVSKDKDPDILDKPLEELNNEINNGGGKMKVKCTKCTCVEELKEDDVKLLAHVVKRYNQKPNPTDYLSVWSIIRGTCTDNDKHTFIFDESFDKEIVDTIKEYNSAVASNKERKIAFEKVCNQIDETNKILKELEKKKTYAFAEMNAGGLLIDNIKLKFLKLTGTEDMNIWS